MVEFVGETFFGYMEYGPFMLNVDDMERTQQPYFRRQISESQLLDGFSTSLFDWSRVWGFTTSSSTIDFISSFSFIPHISSPVITCGINKTSILYLYTQYFLFWKAHKSCDITWIFFL